MAFKTSEKYKSVIYSGDCRHKLKLLFNGVELTDADVYCESLKVTSRILANGSTRFSLDNFIAKEAELILHDIDTTKIQSPVNISIGTLVDGTYEYVPIGLFVVQDLPTTDKNKTTIKLRDYAVKFDFGYNAKDIIDENGGSVTKLQILQDICSKAGVETDITKFYGSNSKIGIYDNTITGRTYISYLAEQAGAIATIDRSGKLIFVQLKDLETVEIPLNIVEKYEDGEKYEISRVVYEDAIRKFEYGDESKDTLFINTANPYIDDEVLTNTLAGTQIETSDSSDNEVVNYKQYGYTKQNVYSGKQLFDVSKISNKNIVVEDNGKTIKLPIDTSGGGYTSTTTKLSELCPNLKVGDDVTLRFTRNLGTKYNNYIYLEKPSAIVWQNGMRRVITQNDLDSRLVLYGNYYTNGETEQVILTDFSIMLTSETNTTWEPYVGGKASPSPDYPQEIEVGRGKNLFDKNAITKGYLVARTDGTLATNASYGASDYIPVKANVDYYQSNTQYYYSVLYDKDKNYVGIVGTQKFTPTQDGYVRVSCLLTNIDIVQVEKGDKATSYLPYNTIETKTKTRNLYPSSSDIPTGYYAGAVKDYENLHNGDVSLYTDKAWQGVYFNLKEIIAKNNLKIGDKLTCSIYFKTNFVHTGNLRFVFYRPTTSSYNGVTTFASDEVKPNEWKRLSFTFEITEYSLTSERARIEAEFYDVNDKYYFGNNRTNYVWFASPQVEVGELTDYQVSNESSIQYNLGDNFLADKDYIENGVLHKNIGKVVLNGSENWTLYSNDNEGISFMLNLSGTAKGVHTSICDKYTNITQAWGNLYKNVYGIYSDHSNYGYKYFRPPNADITTVEQWKAWLSENNIEMYYQLETPEQIPLETTGELRTFEPNTIITNDLNSEMEVEYKMNRTQVSQILELNKNISLNSFKTGKIIGNPAIDAYDIIKIVDDDKEFKTLATNDLTYNGVMINSFDTQIGKEAKKENVTLTPEATFKKWAKTEIDNVEASVKITTGKIEEAVLDLETDVNNNSVNINNNYQEILGKFEGYTPTSQTIQLEQSVTQLQTDTYTKTEINTKLTDGSVTKVRTTSGTFDEDGMHYEKTGAPTKSTINEAGVSVDSSSSGEELLFAGYDKDINQTIVRTENLTVRRYLVVGENTRIEDYTDEDGNVGGGLFIL